MIYEEYLEIARCIRNRGLSGSAFFSAIHYIGNWETLSLGKPNPLAGVDQSIINNLIRDINSENLKYMSSPYDDVFKNMGDTSQHSNAGIGAPLTAENLEQARERMREHLITANKQDSQS